MNPPRPLLDMATSDTTPRVSTLFHCVLFSNSCPSPERLQRPAARGQCHRSIGRSVTGDLRKATLVSVELPLHFSWQLLTVLYTRGLSFYRWPFPHGAIFMVQLEQGVRYGGRYLFVAQTGLLAAWWRGRGGPTTTNKGMTSQSIPPPFPPSLSNGNPSELNPS